MEYGKGLSNDTNDSRTSNASSREQEISTGFSATPDQHSLSISAFDDGLDAQLDLEYSELDALQRSQTSLWSQTQPSKMSMLHCLPFDQRPRSMRARDNYDTLDTNFFPLENTYNSSSSTLFQFSGSMGTNLHESGESQLWQKPRDNSNSFAPSSPRVMASKLLESMQAAYVETARSGGTHVESEVSFPAEKKRRSMTKVGKLEYDPLQELAGRSSNRQTSALPPQYDFSAEMGSRLTSKCEEKVRPVVGSTVMGTRELHTMEQLLVQCASALEASDITSAQQTIFAINNIAAVDGDPNQRLLAHFLRALILRASKFAPHLQLPAANEFVARDCRKLKTMLELTNYIDVMPWYRFGFIAANGAMLEAFEGKEKVHILDFNISHCMQWPTLIESLAERSEGPPHVRLTVCVSESPIPPLLEVSYDELILRLAKFARSKNVPFECELLVMENLDPSKISIRDGEALAVNCLFRLHYVSEECQTPSAVSPRDQILRLIRNLNPAIVTLTEQDANLTSFKMVTRLRAGFNYLWIPFDALHTLLPKESQQRLLYEAEVASKIENLIACEGRHRIERMETKDRWVQRMRRAGFEMVSFSEDVVAENKLMLGEHSGCWSLRKDEEEDALFLNWKGHSVSFATAWVPVDDQAVHLPL